MAKAKSKQESGWLRAKKAGRVPVMIQLSPVDHEIVVEAALKAGLSIAGYCQLQVRAGAYSDTGKTPADRRYAT